MDQKGATMRAAIAAIEPTTVAVYLRVSSAHQHEENQVPDVDRLVAARYPGAAVLTYGRRRATL